MSELLALLVASALLGLLAGAFGFALNPFKKLSSLDQTVPAPPPLLPRAAGEMRCGDVWLSGELKGCSNRPVYVS